MYRNVTYKSKLIDGEYKGEITLYTWDDKGNPITEIYPHRSQLFYEAPTGKNRSIFDTPLKVQTFHNEFLRRNWIRERGEDYPIYNCLPPTREFLVEKYGGQQENDDFLQYPLRTQFLDLEVAVENEFPQPKDAKYPINVLTVHDSTKQKYFCWIYVNSKWYNKPEGWTNTEDKEYFVFTDEYSMLTHFLKWFQDNRPDVISGWNIMTFDIPYLINRIKNILGGEVFKCLSPSRNVYSRKMEKSKDETYRIEGVSLLDYIFLYKSKFGPPSRQSYKLEDVAQDELGYGKLSYEGTFKEFYKNDFRTFVDYNIQDVKCCVDLDTKLQFILLVRIICAMGLVELEAIYKSQPYIYGAILLEALKDGKRVPSNKTIHNDKSSFEGAFVFEPNVGIYKDGVFSTDLNSLYPSIVINNNISPETKMGKIIDTNEETGEITILLHPPKGNAITKIVNKEKFLEKIKGKMTVSANGIFFTNPNIKQGVIPRFLARLYANRKKIKKEMIKKKQEITKYERALKTLDDLENHK